MRKLSSGSGFVDPKDAERARLLALALFSRDPIALARLSAPSAKSKGKAAGCSSKVEVGSRGNYLGRSLPAKKPSANSFLLGPGSGEDDSVLDAAARLPWSPKVPSFLDDYKSVTAATPHEARYMLSQITPEQQQADEVRHDDKKLGNFVRQMRKTTPGLRTWAETKLRSETKAFERQISTGTVLDNEDNRRLLAEKYSELQKFNNNPLRGATKRERERFEAIAEMAYNPAASMKRMADTGVDLADFFGEYQIWKSSGARSDGQPMVSTTDGKVIPISDAAKKIAAANKISMGDLFRQMDGRMGKHFRKVFSVTANAVTKTMENQTGLNEKDIYLKRVGGLDDGVSSASVGMQNRSIRSNPDLAQIGDLEAIWRHAQDGFNNPVTILSQAVDSSINKGKYRTDDELAPGEKLLRFFTDQIVQNMATEGAGSAAAKSMQALKGLKAIQPVMKGLAKGSQALDKLGVVGSIARVGGKQALGAIPGIATQARIDSNTTGKNGWQAVKDAAAGQVKSITDLSYLNDPNLSLEDKAIRALQQGQILGAIAKRHANTPAGIERASGWLKNAGEHPNLAAVSNALQKIASALPKEKRAGFEKASRSLLEKMAEKPQPLGRGRTVVPASRSAGGLGELKTQRSSDPRENYHVEHELAETRDVPTAKADHPDLVQEVFDSVEKKHLKISPEQLSGQPGQSHEQVAQQLQMLRRADYETLRVVLVKDGKILTTESLSQKKINSAPTSPRGKEMEHWFDELIAEHKPDTIYLAHNHPSGSPKPSKPDIDATSAVHDQIARRGVTFGGHIVMDHKEYGFIPPKGETTYHEVDNVPLTNTFQYKGLNKSYITHDDMAKLAKMFDPSGNHVMLLETTWTGEVRKVRALKPDILRQENFKDLRDLLTDTSGGGIKRVLVLPDKLHSLVSKGGKATRDRFNRLALFAVSHRLLDDVMSTGYHKDSNNTSWWNWRGEGIQRGDSDAERSGYRHHATIFDPDDPTFYFLKRDQEMPVFHHRGRK